MTEEEKKVRREKLKKISENNDRMSDFAKEAIKEGLVVSMSEGRRLYVQTK